MDGLAVLGIIGGVATLAALYGGIEVLEIKIPALPIKLRIVSGIFGVILIGYTMWIIDKQSSSVPQLQPNQASTSRSQITGTISVLTSTTQPTFQSQSSPTVIREATSTTMPIGLPRICGFDAFNGNSLATTSPLFQRPEGYTSGWITSDQSNLILPDGTKETITTRYALVVENLTEVQLQNVRIGDNGHANTWGCWYSTGIDEVMSDAGFEYDKMKTEDSTVIVTLYRLTSQGLEKIKP